MSEPTVSVVGLGRVGSTLALALRRSGWPMGLVWDRDPAVRRQARRRLGREGVARSLDQAMGEADLVVLAVAEGAWDALEVPGRGGAMFVHTSGILTSEALGRFRAAGHGVGSWHPLRGFAARWDLPRSGLEGTVFGVEGDRRVVTVLRRLTRQLGARAARLHPERKALYHAAAAMAANHTIFLAFAAEQWFRQAGLAETDARRAVGSLLQSVASNVTQHGSRRALTGPLAREDFGTIEAHLDAIHRLDPAGRELYEATLRAAVSPTGIVGERGARVRRRLSKVMGARRKGSR